MSNSYTKCIWTDFSIKCILTDHLCCSLNIKHFCRNPVLLCIFVRAFKPCLTCFWIREFSNFRNVIFWPDAPEAFGYCEHWMYDYCFKTVSIIRGIQMMYFYSQLFDLLEYWCFNIYKPKIWNCGKSVYVLICPSFPIAALIWSLAIHLQKNYVGA